MTYFMAVVCVFFGGVVSAYAVQLLRTLGYRRSIREQRQFQVQTQIDELTAATIRRMRDTVRESATYSGRH